MCFNIVVYRYEEIYIFVYYCLKYECCDQAFTRTHTTIAAAEIKFKVAVVTSSVAKITFVVAEIILKWHFKDHF